MRSQLSDTSGSWAEYQKLVLSELERHNSWLAELQKISSDLKNGQTEMALRLTSLATEIHGLTQELGETNRLTRQLNSDAVTRVDTIASKLDARITVIEVKVATLEEREKGGRDIADERDRAGTRKDEASSKWVDRLWTAFWTIVTMGVALTVGNVVYQWFSHLK